MRRSVVSVVFVVAAVLTSFVGGTVFARPAPFRHQAVIGFPVYVGEAPVPGVTISYIHDTHNPQTCLAVVMIELRDEAGTLIDTKVTSSPAVPDSCPVPVDTQ